MSYPGWNSGASEPPIEGEESLGRPQQAHAEGAPAIDGPAPDHHPAPGDDHDHDHDSEHRAHVDDDDEDAETPDRLHKGLIGRLNRESRFGIAAMLSFLVIVSLLIYNRGREKGKPEAEGGRKIPPITQIPGGADAPDEGSKEPPLPPPTITPTTVVETSPPVPDRPSRPETTKRRPTAPDPVLLAMADRDEHPALSDLGRDEAKTKEGEAALVPPPAPVPVPSNPTEGADPAKNVGTASPSPASLPEATPPDLSSPGGGVPAPNPVPLTAPDPPAAEMPAPALSGPGAGPSNPPSAAEAGKSNEPQPPALASTTAPAKGHESEGGLPPLTTTTPEPNPPAPTTPTTPATPPPVTETATPATPNPAPVTAPAAVDPGNAPAATPPSTPTPTPTPVDTGNTPAQAPAPAPVPAPTSMPTPVDPGKAQAEAPAPVPLATPTPTPTPAANGSPAAAPPVSEPTTPTDLLAPGPAPTLPPPPPPVTETHPKPNPATAPAPTTPTPELPPLAPAAAASTAVSSSPKSEDPKPATEPGWVVLPNARRSRTAAEDRLGPDPEPIMERRRQRERPTPVSEAPANAPPERPEQVETVPHVVQSGENFWSISQLYYGSGRFYKGLWAANRKTVPEMVNLRVNQTIRIPPPESLDPALIEKETPTAAAARPTSGSTASARSRKPAARASESPAASAGEVEVALPMSDPFARRRAELANSAEADEPTPIRRPTHKVRPYETLRSIARDTLGDSRRADEILDLNSEVIDNPAQLVTGQLLELPEDAKVGARRPR